MAIPLTPEILAAAYSYLQTTPPYCNWGLPDSEDVKFLVVNHPGDHGRYTCSGRGKKRIHYISISRGTVAHTSTLMATMAHEMVHVYQCITGQRSTHAIAFGHFAQMVCDVHGFDPKAF